MKVNCTLVYFLKVQKYHCSVKNNLRSSGQATAVYNLMHFIYYDHILITVIPVVSLPYLAWPDISPGLWPALPYPSPPLPPSATSPTPPSPPPAVAPPPPHTAHSRRAGGRPRSTSSRQRPGCCWTLWQSPCTRRRRSSSGSSSLTLRTPSRSTDCSHFQVRVRGCARCRGKRGHGRMAQFWGAYFRWLIGPKGKLII